jgi:LPPG:FO 2-phospho-L-lactate transferase
MSKRIAYLSGGVGGARLLDGLAQVLAPEQLTAIVNIGDDFDHLGLRVCPDLDTVMYTLAGLADEARGWGLLGETFRALEQIRRYGGESWFALGDGDLGTHIARTQALSTGRRLTEVTQRLASSLGIQVRILPVSDDRLETRIETEREGTLSFQDWLVRRRAEPAVKAISFRGSARASTEALAALDAADVIVIGPSNPYVSIDPMFAVRGLRERLFQRKVVAVSPIVSGRAIKGPLAEMIPKLANVAPSAGAIAAHYGSLLAAMIVEHGDEHTVTSTQVLGASTVMRTREDRRALARTLLDYVVGLG